MPCQAPEGTDPWEGPLVKKHFDVKRSSLRGLVSLLDGEASFVWYDRMSRTGVVRGHAVLIIRVGRKFKIVNHVRHRDFFTMKSKDLPKRMTTEALLSSRQLKMFLAPSVSVRLVVMKIIGLKKRSQI